MKDLVEFLAKSLVDTPEKVDVKEIVKEEETVYEIRVATEDMGRIIGKQGKVAKALRTVVKAAAIKRDIKVHLEIVE